nr:Crp/Fnr family transcriptional regulator [uncultured Desulfobacter sp.]
MAQTALRNRLISTAGKKIDLELTPLLDGLPPDLQQALIRQGRIRSMKKGQLLFMAGDPVDSIFFVVSGKLKEYFSTKSGDVCLRSIYFSGSYISLHAVFLGWKTYAYTCEAIRPTTCVVWPANAFMQLLQREPVLGLRVAAILAEKIENTCRLQCLCRKTQALSRVAGFLLRHSAASENHPRSWDTGLGCTKRVGKAEFTLLTNIRPLELTASNICLARETFSRALSMLQEQGYIRTRGGMVEILDTEGLKQICGASD